MEIKNITTTGLCQQLVKEKKSKKRDEIVNYLLQRSDFGKNQLLALVCYNKISENSNLKFWEKLSSLFTLKPYELRDLYKLENLYKQVRYRVGTKILDRDDCIGQYVILLDETIGDLANRAAAKIIKDFDTENLKEIAQRANHPKLRKAAREHELLKDSQRAFELIEILPKKLNN